jgi:hypothetical protein
VNEQRYVALRPVRFDRNYAIGEEISGGVVAQGSVKRLIEQGRIGMVAATAVEPLASANADLATNPKSNENEVETTDDIIPDEVSLADESNSRGEETFVCEVCGAKFNSQRGLTNHLRTHKDGQIVGEE